MGSPSVQDATLGFIVLERVFEMDEVVQLRTSVENVLKEVTQKAAAGLATIEEWPDGHRLETVDGATVHWEPAADTPAVRSLAPVTHLDPVLEQLWDDERIKGPARELIGATDIGPFSSVLNCKRAGSGSEFRWHQDYPGWYCYAGADAKDVVNIAILLDDATAENGALEVIPGSHRRGPAPRDRAEPTGSLLDTARVDVGQSITVEAPAGSVLAFPGLMVHRSGPNRSDRDRRSLILRCQPKGRKAMQELSYDRSKLSDLP